ncbi:MAG: DUF2520 domain-containing protein [Acidimicrobiia bacterium]
MGRDRILKIVVIGPGRAGGSLALAARRSNHEIVGVLSRGAVGRFGPALSWDVPIPECDLLLIAVRDDAIAGVAERIAPLCANVRVAAHVSGFTPVTALEPLSMHDVAIGGFHPLQTLPDPERGAAALPGSYVGVGGDGPATTLLVEFAGTLGLRPFLLADGARPAYHAAAAAASNFVITSLATAGELFESAEIDPSVARPLVERAVANFFESWPEVPLTGPIARGDIETVRGHLESANAVSQQVGRSFRLLSEATANLAGRDEEVAEWS